MLRWINNALRVLVILLLAVFLAIPRITIPPQPKWLADALHALEPLAAWAVVVLTILFFFVERFAGTIRRRSARADLEESLDVIRNEGFNRNNTGEDWNILRAWYFQHCGRWLKPKESTAHCVKRPPNLLARNANDYQGLAGKAWAEKKCQGPVLLPDVTSEGLVDLDEEKRESRIAEYAEKTSFDVAWLKQQLELGTDFPMQCAAIPVIQKNNRVLGVVVLESYRRDGQQGIKDKFKHAYVAIGQILAFIAKRS